LVARNPVADRDFELVTAARGIETSLAHVKDANHLWTSLRRVGVDAALAIARREARQRGWPWREPISVRRALLAYHIVAGAECRDGIVVVLVWAWSGRILSASFGETNRSC
jgi:hypothetical protein